MTTPVAPFLFVGSEKAVLVDCPDLVTLLAKVQELWTPPESGLLSTLISRGGRPALSASPTQEWLPFAIGSVMFFLPTGGEHFVINFLLLCSPLNFKWQSHWDKFWWEPSMVKHACNFSSRGQRQKDHHEFEASWGYIVNSRATWATKQDSCLKILPPTPLPIKTWGCVLDTAKLWFGRIEK